MFSERGSEIVDFPELESVDQMANRAVVVGAPQDGAQCIGAWPETGRPGSTIPAGEADTSALAPGQRIAAQQTVGRLQRGQTDRRDTTWREYAGRMPIGPWPKHTSQDSERTA